MNTQLTKYRKLMAPLALAFTSIIGSNNQAQALDFNFTFSNDTPLEVRSVFWDAGDAWSKQFTDDVTVNIFVDYGQLPTKVLAGSRPGMTRVVYSEFLTGIRQDKSSQDGSKYISQDYDDARVLSKLQTGDTFKYLSNTGTVSGSKVSLTRANAKALSLINRNNSDYNNFDASIRISNTASWHFDTTVAAPSGKNDLLTVVTHEIGHALGFVSGVDASQLLSAQNLVEHVTPMDMLRYSQQSAAQKISDWTTNQTYFSLDGGSNNLGDFSRGTSEDYQAGHWKHGDSRGIMTPFLPTGSRLPISEHDMRLLDATGWDRAAQLSKNVVSVMPLITWNTSNPDLSLLENVLKAHLNVAMEKLRVERDTIKYSNPGVWSELQAKANEEYQKRQQGIQETLNKVRVEKYNPDKRMEEALKGASDHLLALEALAKVYGDKLQAPLAAQINNWLNGSSDQLKNNLENATQLQIRTLAVKLRNASGSQAKVKEALRLLYQKTHNYQYPSEIELNTALAKLLDAAAPDQGAGWSYRWRYWQTGDTSSSFEKTGEFTFHSAAPLAASVPESASTTGMLGLGLSGIALKLLHHGKKSRANA